MHPKVKSTVSGLVVVAAFVFGSAWIGEPVLPGPGEAADGVTQPGETASLALDESLGQADASRSARARAGNHRRLHLTMPYVASRVSVGRLLGRAGES